MQIKLSRKPDLYKKDNSYRFLYYGSSEIVLGPKLVRAAEAGAPKFRSLNPGFLVGYREYQGSFRKPQTRSAELPAHGRLLRRQSQNFFGGAAMSKFWSLLLNWILGLGL